MTETRQHWQDFEKRRIRIPQSFLDVIRPMRKTRRYGGNT